MTRTRSRRAAAGQPRRRGDGVVQPDCSHTSRRIHHHLLEFLAMSAETSVILVTGGSGLIGQAVQYAIEHETVGSRFGKKPGETWIFAGVTEGDLK